MEPYDELMTAMIVAQATDSLGVDVLAKLVDQLMIDGTDTAKPASQSKVVAGVSTYRERIYVPAIVSLRGTVISPNMTSLSPVILVLKRLLRWYLGISTGQ